MVAQPLKERILSNIKEDSNGCWIWQLFKNERNYGKIKLNGKSPNAHRVSYEVFKGEIPEGLQIDHTCHTTSCGKTNDCPHRSCVNPNHLEAVEPKENVARSNHYSKQLASRTSCKHGHAFTPENTWIEKNYKRHCKTCHRERELKRYHANRLEMAVA